MYAHIMTVDLGPGMRDECTKLAERWIAAVSTIPGFIDVTFFGDDDKGQYGYFSLWETQESADKVVGSVRPQVTKALLTQAKKPPIVRIYEVYQPRSRT